MDAAVDAAAAAFGAWAAKPFAQRAAVLYATADAIERRVEQIAQDMTAEMGKPLRESRVETARGAQILRFYAGEAWRPKGELFDVRLTHGHTHEEWGWLSQKQVDAKLIAHFQTRPELAFDPFVPPDPQDAAATARWRKIFLALKSNKAQRAAQSLRAHL